MIENDLPDQEVSPPEGEQGNMSANQISIFARLLNIGTSMLDTLELFLAPHEMLHRIDGEIDYQSYNSREEVNRNDDRHSAT